MGSEFAQFIEWDYKKELDWSLLSFEKHRQTKDFVKSLNKFYLENSALYDFDFDERGFQWISGEDYAQSIICFRRKAKDGTELIIVCNFAPVTRENYRIGVHDAGSYKTVFCSDWEVFGGKTEKTRRGVKTDKISMHGEENSLELTIPGMAVTVYQKFKRNTK